MRTLPSCLYYGKVEDHEWKGVGIFTGKDLKASTRFGPMEGELISYRDITPTSDMAQAWILEDGYKAENQYLSMEVSE